MSIEKQREVKDKRIDGGETFVYPFGIGPIIINNCFGDNYAEGDPCYRVIQKEERCANMLEGANYIGVGFDRTSSRIILAGNQL